VYNSKIKHVHLHPQGMHKETKEGWGGSCMVPMCDIAAKKNAQNTSQGEDFVASTAGSLYA